ncbi:MAG: 16S rRNA (guanine(966)-N(2))-methyltransferase RsmD [Gemmatimonadota bacterium]|jgi:16S rRNA (guanine(966)-N(2))-methyltransferase RsmD|nr:16S rRNA (guanine(966)-N(2))-methyltransferase RsmD [Gemmatimonadota bacterium]MDP6460244.1 16S rRNA (guanine(966)-N(2))-methyltransferase RsmD [Gemmatimonadota bacterium]MDP6529298.1 16S rRNA (guanine(966)-N(2))-methyltransferase RsmD [Gemmatimonadota bacterium]MDP6802183.1 16S rRNA (guanine(966)-N(2))-methyltransferase RsmD [Gemmatimonadota bacterium]MDP7031513.1 16S rRNA (guanine(966)-N(2))-methyltransferase RsmD [Gemmatimonadota bacterium]
MRIVGGGFRGRKLRAPEGTSTRPTADRVRESIFDLLGPVLPGTVVLDLFAGSGALGLEALSRGAIRAVFVERAQPALRVLRGNLTALGVAESAAVWPGDAFRVLADRRDRFDLVFADPPYREELEQPVADLASLVLADGGVFVLEHSAVVASPEGTGGMTVWKHRRYGGTSVTLYRKQSKEIL